jgi:hypothetical protein
MAAAATRIARLSRAHVPLRAPLRAHGSRPRAVEAMPRVAPLRLRRSAAGKEQAAAGSEGAAQPANAPQPGGGVRGETDPLEAAALAAQVDRANGFPEDVKPPPGTEGAEVMSSRSPLATAVLRFMRKIMPGFDSNLYRERRAYRYYVAAVAQSGRLEFHEFCAVPYFFPSIIGLSTLHMWMFKTLLYKLDSEEVSRDILERMMTMMVRHHEQSFPDHGISPFVVNQQSRKLQEEMFGACVAYDVAYQIRDRDNGYEFAGALHRNVYRGLETVDSACVLMLKDYAFEQLAALDKITHLQFVNSQFQMLPPPSMPPKSDAPRIDLSFYREPIVNSENIRY